MTVQILNGDCRQGLRSLPDASLDCVITSPPYNIGKAYETVAPIDLHLAFIDDVIGELARILVPSGSICWQVGNFVDGTAQAIVPLDIVTYPLFVSRGFKLHNRIVWTFGHGLHCSRRFSGRYETVMWLSRSCTCDKRTRNEAATIFTLFTYVTAGRHNSYGRAYVRMLTREVQNP
jgi:adenine-specific DNA-methyltransferase